MPGPMGRRRGKSLPKEKLDLAALKKLVIYCKKFIPAIAFAIVLSLIGTVPSIVGPTKISQLLDVITEGIKKIEGIDINQLIEVGVFLIIIYAAGGLISYGQSWIMSVSTQGIAKKIRSDINNKLNNLPLRYFDTTTRGDILSRATNDVDIISQTLASTLASLVSAVVLFVGVLFMMVKTNIFLTMISVVCSLFGFISMSLLTKKSQKYFDNRQDVLGDLNGHIEEIFTNHHVVDSFNGKQEALNKFDKMNSDYAHNSFKAEMISSFMRPLMNFSGNLAYAAIFVIGILMIINGSSILTYGTIISFTMYSRMFTQPLGTFAQSMTSLQQASAASKRVFKLLEETELEDESDKKISIESVKGNVSFKNVNFSYVEGKEIIHDFSYEIKAGQKVAIVGPTGAGKTTIVNLLMRFYDINSGSICVDGINTNTMKREEVRDMFDMILQDTWLFQGTIRENLVFNQKDVSDQRLDIATEAVGLKHFIKALPKGYDTYLDDSVALSEGQKQQLTIARAMIKYSPLLILDEATSNVDTRTELIIQKAMDELTVGRTSFIIAHRLSTIKNADIILVMNKGDIVEAGSHEELLNKKGFYYDLYNSQFENA